jgi:hypothetical protein
MRNWLKLTVACALLGIVSSGVANPSPGGPPSRGKGAWKAPVLVHSDQAHRETSLAMSPTEPGLMVVCAPSGVPNTQHNQSYFHLTHDGGRTWKPERVEGGQSDARNYTFEGGDCDVAFDEAGTMYAADTWLGNLSVGHSTDKGETWAGTPLAVSGLVVDRPWLVGGPKGTIHVTYQDLQCCTPSTIWYARSTDFGQTFTPTTSVATAGPDGGFTWEGNFVVSPDGNDLYLVYSRRSGPTPNDLDSSGPETLWVAASHDAGLTWNSELVASMPNPVSYLYPSIAMDKGGNLHVVFASRTETDRPIWYSFSKDQGVTWAKPLPLMRKVAGYSPWVAANRTGAAVVWYGSPDPETTSQTESDWYFYWARVRNADSGSPKVTGGTTTREPIFSGRSGIPEFEMVRLDKHGRMHIGASAFIQEEDHSIGWAIYYQRER